MSVSHYNIPGHIPVSKNGKVNQDLYYCTSWGVWKAVKKYPLTPKQKKARAKAKRAKQARKINQQYLGLNRWQLKKLKKEKLQWQQKHLKA